MKTWRFVFLSAICAGVLAAACAAQQQPPTPPPAGAVATAAQSTTQPATNVDETLRQRSKAYYTALTRGDRGAARQYVAPDQVAQFEQIDLRSLIGASTTGVEVSPAGDTAVVTTSRVFGPPYNLSIAWKDNWKNINGEWLLTFPAHVADNPFGIKPSDQPVDEEAVKRQIEWQNKTVDPDQAYKAVEKLQREEMEKRQADMAAKAAQQQAEQQANTPKSKKKSKKNPEAPKDVKQNSLTTSPSSPKQQ